MVVPDRDASPVSPPGGPHVRGEVWDLDGLILFAPWSTGSRPARTGRHVRRETGPVLGVGLRTTGAGGREVPGGRQPAGALDVHVCDPAVPHRCAWPGRRTASGLLVPLDRLGVSVACGEKAAPRLQACPLHPVVHRHLADLLRDPGAVAADPGAPDVARATVGLVRALLVSAAADDRPPLSRSVADDTLLTRVRAFVREHLADPALGPEMIARQHGVSVRGLYGLFRRAGTSLEQWIITERLEQAHEDLASAACDGLTVEAVARRRGFGQASHFGRRFREDYGISPGAWRRLARSGRPGRS
ncbi:helix-turn-helix domain-containing protein [Streptomyces sp. NPDC002640]